ncbi:hypothetical protein AC579_2599 [Pseudocercospora musae]|uniref:Uncharacterized protein n=1 Tax=Pseudocercospora musae TaxID=113226 RepID=A0A139IEZ7_9PEZI|nr:hypothetical protein AC579_2599 [Pseudocercospora musae]
MPSEGLPTAPTPPPSPPSIMARMAAAGAGPSTHWRSLAFGGHRDTKVARAVSLTTPHGELIPWRHLMPATAQPSWSHV